METKKANSVDEYISNYPVEVQERLKQLRKLITETAPDAQELISYGMPGYKLNKNPLVYFGAFNNHIGFFPIPSGVEAFKKEFENYSTSKGGIQFPHNKPIPLDLIKKIVKFRIGENLGY